MGGGGGLNVLVSFNNDNKFINQRIGERKHFYKLKEQQNKDFNVLKLDSQV